MTPRRTVHYTIEVDVDERYAPGLMALTDAVADRLEDEGADESHYDVQTHGPAELRIGFVDSRSGVGR